MNTEKERVSPRCLRCLSKLPLVAGIALLAVLAVAVMAFRVGNSKKQEAEVAVVSTLERIINVSDLSTFTAVYNGIAKVTSEKDEEKVDFYVAYEAQVEAGIDFSAIDIRMEGNTVTVELPEAQINNISVDIASMDFMFFNQKANTSTVSERAYKACEQDAQIESENQGAILELAHQNAQNVIRALVQPVIEPLGEEYELVVN